MNNYCKIALLESYFTGHFCHGYHYCGNQVVSKMLFSLVLALSDGIFITDFNLSIQLLQLKFECVVLLIEKIEYIGEVFVLFDGTSEAFFVI